MANSYWNNLFGSLYAFFHLCLCAMINMYLLVYDSVFFSIIKLGKSGMFLLIAFSSYTCDALEK
jgi:hypothetical protein